MKARVFIIAALLAGGFYFWTSSRDLALFAPRSADSAKASPVSLWSGPETVRSAGLSADEVNNIEIYKRANMATVNITSTVYQRGWFAQLYPARNSGSGFLVDNKGHILTNDHVISGSNEIQVTTADQKKFKARVLERDPGNDLALIKIEPRGDVTAMKLGDSDSLQVGQKVLAIGNPFSFSGTLTTGVVSSLGRQLEEENGVLLEGLIQTDAAINQGNSGGPLLDSQGNVIGINTAIIGPAGGNVGIGFAMPINKAKQMLDDYQSGRRYEPARLGVTVVPVGGNLAEYLDLPAEGGLLVQSVQPGSAAEKAGIRGARREEIIGGYTIGVGGDLIVALNGRRVERQDAISRALQGKRAGDSMEITVLRGGRLVTVKVTLGSASGASTRM